MRWIQREAKKNNLLSNTNEVTFTVNKKNLRDHDLKKIYRKHFSLITLDEPNIIDRL